MRITSIKTGDIVRCNKRGRIFHAKVIAIEAVGTVLVEPIERNISYRHLVASEITDHWAHSTATRRSKLAPRPQDLSLGV